MISRVARISQRYAASASLVRDGSELMAVRDESGANFDSICRKLYRLTKRDGSDVWEQLFGAIKVMRWLLITGPVPIEHNEHLRDAVFEIERQISKYRGAVAENSLLAEISEAASSILKRDPAVGGVLLESLVEVGINSAIVVAANGRSCQYLSEWLGPLGGKVLTLGELERANVSEDIAYFVGPPLIFGSNAVTAPRTSEVTFIAPAWFSDRTIPQSPIAQYAESHIEVPVRVIETGDKMPHSPKIEINEIGQVSEQDLLPQPTWGFQKENRAPGAEEVVARKVLLSGSRYIWLDDDGERIRTLDPKQPPGERVRYAEVSSISPGVFLLLREGRTESEALRERAFEQIGGAAGEIQRSQESWKARLHERLTSRSLGECERELKELGVGAFGQVHVWPQSDVIRPRSNKDFRLLLAWLDLPDHPYVEHALTLRNEVGVAARTLRERLEDEANIVDLRRLILDGHLRLDIDEPGFRGMFVTRVLAISPFTQVISRYTVRMPFEDEGIPWLE